MGITTTTPETLFLAAISLTSLVAVIRVPSDDLVSGKHTWKKAISPISCSQARKGFKSQYWHLNCAWELSVSAVTEAAV